MKPISALLESNFWLLAILSIALILPLSVQATENTDFPFFDKVEEQPYTLPNWFKNSFLEIAEDVDEAAAVDRHVMLFFHLDNCIYCARMLKENFTADTHQDFLQEHFDVIAINIRGAREVVFNEEVTMPEKELAQALKVDYTPTILFLDHENSTVARLNGYRSSERFMQVAEFVAKRAYKSSTLSDYLEPEQDDKEESNNAARDNDTD